MKQIEKKNTQTRPSFCCCCWAFNWTGGEGRGTATACFRFAFSCFPFISFPVQIKKHIKEFSILTLEQMGATLSSSRRRRRRKELFEIARGVRLTIRIPPAGGQVLVGWLRVKKRLSKKKSKTPPEPEIRYRPPPHHRHHHHHHPSRPPGNQYGRPAWQFVATIHPSEAPTVTR